jgi:hypothetical protein
MTRLLLPCAVITALLSQPLGGLQPERSMSAAANALIAALDDTQRGKLRFAFEAEERLNWHFIPRERKGLPLKDMAPRQREAAMALLKTGLSSRGFTKAEVIRSLENVLRALENGRITRDPELYFFTIFGEPGAAAWGWRYEGHHISQNWTVVNGRPIATTPAFLGVNPADVRDGPMKGTRALAAEGDVAFALLTALTPAQRAQAVVSDVAPRDIITLNTVKTAPIDDTGILASALTAAQQAMLMSLIEEHASVQASALAEQRLRKVRADGVGRIRFAWLGAGDRSGGHYYRIQGDSFLIEYDNVQNNANHQHIVWRDFAGDFGVDLIKLHHAEDPIHKSQREDVKGMK